MSAEMWCRCNVSHPCCTHFTKFTQMESLLAWEAPACKLPLENHALVFDAGLGL
jgi:hypothetical protein